MDFCLELLHFSTDFLKSCSPSFEMTIFTQEELNKLAKNQRKSATYPISAELASKLYSQMIPDLTEMTNDQICELKDFFGEIPLNELGKIYVGGKCPTCNRCLTIVDQVNGALRSGIHDKKFMALVLNGKLGHFITIHAKGDQSHCAICVECGAACLGPYACRGYVGWDHDF